MSLSLGDQVRLAKILQLARKLENVWPEKNLYQELKREIAACIDAEGASLNRLAERATHLHDEVSLTHFYSCIVPFERLSGRTLRYVEFLVAEGDAHAKEITHVPLKLIVENVRSAFNVGALFRTAECVGASEILLCGYTPDPNDEKTARTAMGVEVPWRRADRAVTACAELRQEGLKIIALETAVNAVSVYEMKVEGPTAFVIGNERFGLDADTLAAADGICRIPTRGVKNSLNVGIAFGVAAFEWLRQFDEL